MQRYYDNLLAKHAAAEMTIDHLRIRAKVGCEDSTLPPASSTTPGNTFSNTLRGRKLTSASLDTCVPALLSKRSHQPRVSGSVASFRDHSTPTRSQCSLNPTPRVSMQPQVHLMPLASSSKHSQRSRLNDGLERPKSGLNNAPNGEGTVASVDDSTDFEGGNA
ncbi:unnamed protein product [Hydatigera taeniaeformis]|uniref:Uncharacterized protein n=1 Tax=Hydatigena taeniaeformis TaxID=6205 RepID=A0A3P7EN12_HYDTA|nr:unnamed protein product [Hydatigera taeniaeformis]